MSGPDSAAYVAAIYNAAWMVRHYRSARTVAMRDARYRAIQAMGLLVRRAFLECDDFESLLAAIAMGLTQQERSDI